MCIFYDTNIPKVNKFEFSSTKLKLNESFTIMQLSDYHDKHFSNDNSILLRYIKENNPDIITITGDYIDTPTSNFKNVYGLLDKIKEINPNIYFISGNHEWFNKNHFVFINGLKERNIALLNNSNTVLKKGDLIINLCGVDDYFTKHSDITKALTNVDTKNFTILLSHDPKIVDILNNTNIDLILSGHTHGGQIRVPFIGGLVSPDEGLFPKLDKGIYHFPDGKALYIDSGLGTVILPFRFLDESQMSLIKISPKNY